MTLSEELTWRGFVNQTTYPDLKALDKGAIHFYWGVDPSADSMQIGNLAAAMMVKCLIKYGHKAVLLVGGATGMIGDPDGKAQERELLSVEQLSINKHAIVQQYHKIFGEGSGLKITDNYDWFKNINYLDFLRDTGKHVSLRQMLARDFVQSRLGDTGISYAEFSYALIQAYDFLELYKSSYHVTLQLCGADQWGNCIAGVDLIRRKVGGEAHVLSMPLIVNKATGQKFGKTEEGAVWLDAKRTSIYRFYQFWLNVDDDGAGDYLKVFTELDKEKIAHVMIEFEKDRGGRAAQKTLAYEVTKLIHGKEEANKQVKIAEALAKQSLASLTDSELSILKNELVTTHASRSATIFDALVMSGLATSKTEAMRLLANNAVSINGQKVTRNNFEFSDFQNGYLLLRRGKAFKDSALVELKD